MRREYKGAAQTAQLTSGLGGTSGDLTIYCDDLTNWPSGISGRPFYVVVNRGQASEEKILCASRTGNTITVWTSGLSNGRGADGTSITAHNMNETIEHIFTATDADEANAHVNDTTTNVHPQYMLDVDGIPLSLIDAKGDLLVGSAADTVIRFPVGSNGDSLVADSTAPGGIAWGAATATLSPFLLMGA